MNLSKQQGITLIGLIFVLGLIGILVLSVLKIAPIYAENLSVQSSVKSIKIDPAVKNMSVSEIRQILQKKLNVNYVTNINAKNANISRSSDGITLKIEYEVRKQYIGNVDIILSFSDEIIIPL